MKNNELHSAENVALRLKAVREYLKLSQKDFAERIEVTPQQYNDWEAGRNRLSLQGALKIYDSFGVDTNWFFLNKADTLPHNMAVAVSSKP